MKTISIEYSPFFLKAIRRLPENLLEEIYDKVDLFTNVENHKRLKVHKLSGKMKNMYSFSVDYKNRIIFEYISSDTVLILDFGNHDIYQ